MKTMFFILGIHNHQPVGNFDHVMSDAFEKAYWPFLQTIMRHPFIKVCLHYSGVLWEWLEEKCPEMIELCKTLIERGQIELISGGFYEPILSIIPDRDKLGQMNKMGLFINQRFGVKPRGIWLAERVWEPEIPKFMYDAGLEYVIVDDLHFHAAGLNDEDLHGYYLTDNQGKVVKVFPGSKKLRYLIPFQSPEKTIEYITQIRDSESGDLAMMADDGEKFGIWPGTYKWVYEQEWLEHFFCLIEKNKDWLKVCTYSEYIKEHAPLGQIYLPTASYAEMEEWALPLKAQKVFHALIDKLNHDGIEKNFHNFIRGGLWRNFLCKYREGKNIYNRMLQISQKIENIENAINFNIKGDKTPEWLKTAKNEVWKGQCNDAYWHGLFGGLYLPHLRAALYSHLIQADNLIEKHRHLKETWCEWEIKDMDQDGFDEILINTDQFCIFVDPNAGGSIYEWDLRPKMFNIINSLMRRPEGYHEKITSLSTRNTPEKENEIKSIHDLELTRVGGLEKLLIYDKYFRNSLIDHFFDKNVSIDDFSSLRYKEKGDFLEKPYQFQIKREPERIEIVLHRTAFVGESDQVQLSKTLTLFPGSSCIEIQYAVNNKSEFPLDAIFGVEFNFNLLAGQSEDRYFLIDGEAPPEYYMRSRGEHNTVQRVCLVDKSLGLKIGIHTQQMANIWRFPIETASNSEGGFEKVYQSSVILFHWPLYLRKQDEIIYRLECSISQV